MHFPGPIEVLEAQDPAPGVRPGVQVAAPPYTGILSAGRRTARGQTGRYIPDRCRMPGGLTGFGRRGRRTAFAAFRAAPELQPTGGNRSGLQALMPISSPSPNNSRMSRPRFASVPHRFFESACALDPRAQSRLNSSSCVLGHSDRENGAFLHVQHGAIGPRPLRSRFQFCSMRAKCSNCSLVHVLLAAACNIRLHIARTCSKLPRQLSRRRRRRVRRSWRYDRGRGRTSPA